MLIYWQTILQILLVFIPCQQAIDTYKENAMLYMRGHGPTRMIATI